MSLNSPTKRLPPFELTPNDIGSLGLIGIPPNTDITMPAANATAHAIRQPMLLSPLLFLFIRDSLA